MSSVIIVFGGGMMAPPCVTLLAQNGYHVVVVDARANSDLSLLSKGTSGKVTFLQADLSSGAEVRRVIKQCNAKISCAVSLLPPPMHPTIATECVDLSVPFVSASYLSDKMRALGDIAVERGIVVLNEMGLDPGMDLMSSAQLINDIQSNGGKVVHYSSLCGALCAPQLSNGPLGYKFSWSPGGVLTAITRPARFMSQGTWFDVKGELLYHLTCPIVDFKGLKLNWIPNGNAEPFVNNYFNIGGPALRTAVRGTMRFDGYGPVALAFQALGLLEAGECDAIKSCQSGGKTWGEYLAMKYKWASGNNAAVLEHCGDVFVAAHSEIRRKGLDKAVAEACFSTSADGSDTSDSFVAPFVLSPVSDSMKVINSFLEDTSFLNTPVPASKLASPHAALTAFLAARMMLDVSKGETDFVSMIHRVVAKYPDGSFRTFESTFAEGGTPYGFSTVANTVGVTVGCAALCVAEKRISTPGIRNPCEKCVFEPVMSQLHKSRIRFQERLISGPAVSSKL